MRHPRIRLIYVLVVRAPQYTDLLLKSGTISPKRLSFLIVKFLEQAIQHVSLFGRDLNLIFFTL